MSEYHTNRWYTDMGKREGHRCENCHLPSSEHYNGRCPITDADREDMAEAVTSATASASIEGSAS